MAQGFDGPGSGVATLLGGNGRPDLIAWSGSRVALFRNGRALVENSGLEELRDVRFIAPGDFDNDGLPDLCVVTTEGRHALSQHGNPVREARRTGDAARFEKLCGSITITTTMKT